MDKQSLSQKLELNAVDEILRESYGNVASFALDKVASFALDKVASFALDKVASFAYMSSSSGGFVRRRRTGNPVSKGGEDVIVNILLEKLSHLHTI